MLNVTQQGGQVVVSGRLQIEFLEQAKQLLVRAAQAREAVALDLSGVEGVDTAGLQMLAAFLKSRPDGVATSITALSAPMERALKLAGMDALVAPHLS